MILFSDEWEFGFVYKGKYGISKEVELYRGVFLVTALIERKIKAYEID